MIASFRSKDLRKFWVTNDATGIRPDWRKRVRLVLSALDAAGSPGDLDLPGFGFHRLTGDQAGRFAVSMSRNWRITFGRDAPDVTDVELEDYHG